jgi:hypothetical protein
MAGDTTFASSCLSSVRQVYNPDFLQIIEIARSLLDYKGLLRLVN